MSEVWHQKYHAEFKHLHISESLLKMCFEMKQFLLKNSISTPVLVKITLKLAVQMETD